MLEEEIREIRKKEKGEKAPVKRIARRLLPHIAINTLCVWWHMWAGVWFCLIVHELVISVDSIKSLFNMYATLQTSVLFWFAFGGISVLVEIVLKKIGKLNIKKEESYLIITLIPYYIMVTLEFILSIPSVPYLQHLLATGGILDLLYTLISMIYVLILLIAPYKILKSRREDFTVGFLKDLMRTGPILSMLCFGIGGILSIILIYLICLCEYKHRSKKRENKRGDSEEKSNSKVM